MCARGQKPSNRKNYWKALRPWSFTASVLPMLLTWSLVRNETDVPLLSMKMLRCMIIVVSVQAGSNLCNSYFDYKKGVDRVETAGDRTIVDQLMSVKESLLGFILLFSISCASAVPLMVDENEMGDESRWTIGTLFLLGLLLAIMYTATPIGLKYIACGDVAVMIAFGPLVMQFTSMCLTSTINDDLWWYSVPMALLAESILHSNNSRDIASDRKAGAYTLASILGFEVSRVVYVCLMAAAFGTVTYLAISKEMYTLLTVYVCLPLAMKAIEKFHRNELVMKTIDEETAKLHLSFGVLLIMGVLWAGK